ncbi:GGDEF domain-containing protein [Paludibacterium yongneupense]|uniref:GGDEF domain-containing protein n=1 Tax=Paludibacterium yongneupense TaxID=400061 RepID=UPI00040075FF|nr:diguanylate cyclase [Paludibacterium yongneupense]
MIPTHTASLRDKVGHLRSLFLARLPGMLEEARLACLCLSGGKAAETAIDDLQRLFHNLKGTAATLGLPELSAESSSATELVAGWRLMPVAMRSEVLPSWQRKLANSIARLAVLECQASAALPPPQGAAAPDLPRSARDKKPDLRLKRVYLCDAELDGRQLESPLLCFGYTLTSFCDTASLLRAAAAECPDAIVVQASMATGLAGYENRSDTPLLIVGDDGDFATRLAAVKAGAVAYFQKPIAGHELVEALDMATTQLEPAPYRVLIVDDEPEMADYHASILESVGMSARRLNEPARILEELDEFQPDLLLMDVYMPIASGRELSRVVRQIPQFVGLPILFLSSETDKMEQVSALQVGADGFLTKPIPPQDLITAVAVRAERTRVLRSLMMRDSLTGLLNHTTLSQFLETSLAAAQRQGVPLCFMMLDVDRFKVVNDTYGHQAGDQVLMALARVLKQRLRNSDMIGRYGGEEFAAVLQGVGVSEAVRFVDAIREDFAALTFKAGDKRFSCSFSCGIAGFPDYETAEGLVYAADQALYAAKRGGRNRVIADAAADAIAGEKQ